MRLKPRPVLGLLLIVGSGVLIFYIFAFSTLPAGRFEEGSAEWWRAVLDTMFAPGMVTHGACFVFVLGAFLFIHGLGAIVRNGVGKSS